MSRQGITYEDVAKAAQKAQGRGKPVTIETVRLELGTGSNSTIGRHLKSWKEQNGTSSQQQNHNQLPEELNGLMKGLWERVLHDANTKIKSFKEATEQEIIDLNMAAQQLQEENRKRQEQYEALQTERDQLKQEKRDFEQRIQDYQIEVARWKSKEEGLLRQLDEKQEWVGELIRQNKQAQINLEHYQESALEQRQMDQQKSEARERDLNYTIQGLKADFEKSREERMALKQNLEQLIFEKGSLRNQLDKMAQHYETASEKIIAEKQLVAQIKAENEWLKNQLEFIHHKLGSMEKELIELKAMYATKVQEKESIGKELENLHKHCEVLVYEKTETEKENTRLLEKLKQSQQFYKENVM